MKGQRRRQCPALNQHWVFDMDSRNLLKATFHFENKSRYFCKCHKSRKCRKRSQMIANGRNDRKWSQMFTNGRKWSQMFANGRKRLQMVANGHKQSQAIANGYKLSQTVTNSCIQSQTVSNDRKWLQTVSPHMAANGCKWSQTVSNVANVAIVANVIKQV